MKKSMVVLMVLAMGLLAGFLPKDASCRTPLPWQAAGCRQIEEAILAATVRISIHGELEIESGYEVQLIKGTVSHATVVDGRYLITHNHFGIPLSQALLYSRHANGGFTAVSLHRLDGTTVLDHGSIDSFEVVAEYGETTVLDFGQGFFSRAGIASSMTAEENELQLPPGSEVAQIDWDDQGHTKVVWTEVTTSYTIDGRTVVRVENYIRLGASGGGVFLDGVHIGNNWGRISRPAAENGAPATQFSLVALNSQ
jgi:hypothetical protein